MKETLFYEQNEKLTENATKFIVPSATLKDPHHARVFYNSAMQFSRSISSAVLQVACQELGSELTLLDGYCSLGIRGMRYAMEIPQVKRTIYVDANDDAIPYLKKNIQLNKLIRKSTVIHGDINKAIANCERFDVIELDPFGTPVFALENAIRRTSKKAVISITATDMANLCGAHPAACLRLYNAKPLNCEICHELAIRILIGKIAVLAAQYDRFISPIASWYQGHYCKVICLMERSVLKADEMLAKQIGYAYHCNKCLERGFFATLKKCTCKKSSYAGKLWTDLLGSADALLKASKKVSGKEMEFLETLASENEFANLHFQLTEVTRRTKKETPKLNSFLSTLRSKGYTAVKSHYAPIAFKTNAPVEEIKNSCIIQK